MQVGLRSDEPLKQGSALQQPTCRLMKISSPSSNREALQKDSGKVTIPAGRDKIGSARVARLPGAAFLFPLYCGDWLSAFSPLHY